ncbi:MAG: nitroreductase family protein, partial [Butyrivibrio sp.]|nr:nitroreductase family protein [Butyrivibrio sp.]
MKEIAARHSIRKYKAEAVNRDDIKKILEAGILAPSAKNRQPWKFIVVEGDKKAEALDVMEK